MSYTKFNSKDHAIIADIPNKKMSNSAPLIEEHDTYHLKGYAIEGIIELAYRFGCNDTKYNTDPASVSQADAISLVKKTLLDFQSFKDLNSK